MNNLVPVQDIERMASAVAKSGLFGVRTPEEAMALMLIAQAEGYHPAIAARDYHIVQGRPTLRADSMLARFQSAGGRVEWKEYTDECVSGNFSHPNGGSLVVTWTLDMAKNIGLVKPNSGWHKYPRAMLRSRCISEAVRAVYPGCIAGTYTPEEVSDFDSPKPAPEVNMGAAEVVEEIAKAKEIGEGFLPLYIPGQDEPYEQVADLFAWEISFYDMINRVKAGTKLNATEKAEKLKAFKKANQEIIETLSNEAKLKVLAAVTSLEAA